MVVVVLLLVLFTTAIDRSPSRLFKNLSKFEFGGLYTTRNSVWCLLTLQPCAVIHWWGIA